MERVKIKFCDLNKKYVNKVDKTNIKECPMEGQCQMCSWSREVKK